jgi:hypothetical protein
MPVAVGPVAKSVAKRCLPCPCVPEQRWAELRAELGLDRW